MRSYPQRAMLSYPQRAMRNERCALRLRFSVAQVEWDTVVQSVEASTYDAAWLYSHRHGVPDDDYVEPNIWGASDMQVMTNTIIITRSPHRGLAPSTRPPAHDSPHSHAHSSPPPICPSPRRFPNTPNPQVVDVMHHDLEDKLWSVVTSDTFLPLRRHQDLVGTISVPYRRVMSDEAGLLDLLHLVRVHGVAFVSETPHSRELSQVSAGLGV